MPITWGLLAGPLLLGLSNIKIIIFSIELVFSTFLRWVKVITMASGLFDTMKTLLFLVHTSYYGFIPRSKIRIHPCMYIWGPVTNYKGGGAIQNGRGGGACEVLPLRKRGVGMETVLAMLKGGGGGFWGSFYAVALSYSHNDGEGGAYKVYTLEGGANSFGPAVFSFCSPPLLCK